MEILKLQSEVDNAKVLMVKEKKTSESMTTRERRKRQRLLQSVENLKAINLLSFPVLDIRVTFEELKKQQLILQKQLEEADYVQAQLSKDEYDGSGFFGGFIKTFKH